VPLETDVEIGRLKLRVRAMTSSQVQHIVRATRDPSVPTGYDLELEGWAQRPAADDQDAYESGTIPYGLPVRIMRWG